MKNKSYWKNWFIAAGIRAIKTMAQTALATIGTTAIFWEVHWGAVFSAAAMAGVYSLLTSIKGLPEVSVEANGEITVEESEINS